MAFCPSSSTPASPMANHMPMANGQVNMVQPAFLQSNVMAQGWREGWGGGMKNGMKVNVDMRHSYAAY